MGGPAEIQLTFNGTQIAVPEGTTIADLLAKAEIRTHLVAVEVNLEIVPRERHAEHTVAPDDIVEAVTLVGGG